MCITRSRIIHQYLFAHFTKCMLFQRMSLPVLCFYLPVQLVSVRIQSNIDLEKKPAVGYYLLCQIPCVANSYCTFSVVFLSPHRLCQWPVFFIQYYECY